MQFIPFTRRCICATPPHDPGGHMPACNENYRKEFMDYKDAARRQFYGTPERVD
jgi:hypothetical protein